MPEYTNNALQTITTNANVLFTETAVPCSTGYVIHRNGAGIFTLKGAVANPCTCYARYKVSFNGNIAVAEGGTVGPISLSITINGESVPTTTAIVTPAAVGDFFNVHTEIIVLVPKGCCYTLSVENTSATSIEVQNANIIIERIA